MSGSRWQDWLSFKRWLRSERPRRTKPAPAKAQLQLESLEERTVPSAAPLDLTTAGASGSINGAIFAQTPTQPTGSGVIHSFVRLQAQGAKQTVQQGYNTDNRPLQFDENKSPTFTRSLKLDELPKVDAGGVFYRVFLLDINQKSSQPLLSLDELRLYVGGAPNLSGYDASAHTLGGLAPVYDLDAGGVDNWVKLDARLTHGSGSGDMLLYVPDSLFTGTDPYVSLYSKFGVNLAGNGGFEEWAPAAGPNSSSGASQLPSSSGVIQGTVTVNGVPQVGVQIFLDANHDGVLDGDEVFTYTDQNGNYSFNDLATNFGQYSAYAVTAVPPTDTTTNQSSQTVQLTTTVQTATVNFSFTTTPATNPQTT